MILRIKEEATNPREAILKNSSSINQIQAVVSCYSLGTPLQPVHLHTTDIVSNPVAHNRTHTTPYCTKRKAKKKPVHLFHNYYGGRAHSGASGSTVSYQINYAKLLDSFILATS